MVDNHLEIMCDVYIPSRLDTDSYKAKITWTGINGRILLTNMSVVFTMGNNEQGDPINRARLSLNISSVTRNTIGEYACTAEIRDQNSNATVSTQRAVQISSECKPHVDPT